MATPIVQSAVFALANVAELRRYNSGDPGIYIYSRSGNPTIRAAEEKIAALEGAEDCVVTASGMAAAFCTFLALCEAGDEIVSMLDIYGGTLRLFDKVLSKLGITTATVPFSELAGIASRFSPRTRVLLLESPTNPTLRCVDVKQLAAVARSHRLKVVFDNTFATPILQKPLQLGADISFHSATKYLGGHSDITAGAVCGSHEIVAKVREIMVLTGGCLDPGCGYLLLRGLKTLELRMERGCRNARALAEELARHPRIKRVMYPGLLDSAQYPYLRDQMSDFGCMLSIELESASEAERFIDALKLWRLATSLGGVESTVSYPVLSSHVGLSEAQLSQMDVSAATVRLSVGIENIEDLISDLRQAIARI